MPSPLVVAWSDRNFWEMKFDRNILDKRKFLLYVLQNKSPVRNCSLVEVFFHPYLSSSAPIAAAIANNNLQESDNEKKIVMVEGIEKRNGQLTAKKCIRRTQLTMVYTGAKNFFLLQNWVMQTLLYFKHWIH